LKTRIFEIFTSIEGEGILYGTKTLFVRLEDNVYPYYEEVRVVPQLHKIISAP